MPPHLVLVFLLLLTVLPSPSAGLPRHTITLRLPSPPTSVLYDPSAQHFILLPPLSFASDAGVLQPLPLSPPPLPSTALALDTHRRRLLLVTPGPSPSLASYDLSSPPPHPRLFLSPLPAASADFRPAAVAVDTSTGAAFVVAAGADAIWRIDADGRSSVLSESKSFADGGGLDGIAYDPKGYLLVAQSSTGKLFKVNPDDGTARLVLMNKKIYGLNKLAVRSDGLVVAIDNGSAWILKSGDGWAEAAVYDKIDIGEGRQAKGVTVRDGRRAYLLHGVEGSEVWKIEEVESERETGGEWVGGLVMVGLGLAIFTYWRFQMRQLVSSMNKKRA